MHAVRTLALLAALLAAAPASASQELRDKIAGLAREILANTKQQPVTVGQFSPTGLPDSNSGPGVEQLLTAALGQLAKADARFEVKGDYALVKSKADPALREAKVTARLFDKDTGDELVHLRLDVRLNNTATIAEVLQVTAALSPAGSREERVREVERAAKEPAVFVHGPDNTLVSAKEGSPFTVAVLAKRNGDGGPAKPRPAKAEKGLAVVAVERDEVYEVKVANNSDHEVAVGLTIDGIDQFHFTEERNDKGAPRFTHWIMPAKTELPIVGWHKTADPTRTDNVLSFLVTGYGEGAVSKAGAARGKVGVLHVSFAQCRPLAPGGRSKSGNETGFGAPREVKQKVVSYEIDPPHEFVAVRYTR